CPGGAGAGPGQLVPRCPAHPAGVALLADRRCGRLRQLDRASPRWLAGVAPGGVARDRPRCRPRRAGAVPASGQHRAARHRPRAEDHHPLMPERPAAAPPPGFLFFGAGAVGSLLGARLAQAGSEVTLVGRPSHVEAVARDGVRMVVAGKVSSQSVRAARPTLADAGGPFDYVFLTVKGYDTLDAIEQLQLVLRPGTILGSFQNGIGNEEAITAALPDQALLAGSLTVPVSLDEPGTIQLHSRSEERRVGKEGRSRGTTVQ